MKITLDIPIEQLADIMHIFEQDDNPENDWSDVLKQLKVFSEQKKLTPARLRSAGFECVREPIKEDDVDGMWVGERSIVIYQDFWNQDSFSFATRTTEDGEFKAGFAVKTVADLINVMNI